MLFFQETASRQVEGGEEEEEEEEEERSADGFIPITELHFVLPDEMVQQAPAQRGAPEQGRTGQLPQSAPPQQGGVAQQQQMGQFQSGPGQPGRQ